MATVVLAKEFQKNLNDEGSLKKPAQELLHLMADDLDEAALHTPPDANDSRVRTVRVTNDHSAVLFTVGPESSPVYVLAAIRHDDEVAQYAAGLYLRLNPANGICELIRPDEPSESADHASTTRRLLADHQATDLERLGILPELAQRAVGAVDEEELNRLCRNAPTWQANALHDLAVGMSLDEVGRIYQVGGERGPGRPVPVDSDDPVQLRDSLNHVATQMDFVVVEGDEHLRRMLEGDFAAWRTFLHPEQRNLVERHCKGSYRVTGGAGTGKTVVAIHRAISLAERHPEARILLTTYTTNLAHQLSASLVGLAGPTVLARIEVLGVDKLARDIVARSRGASPQTLSQREESQLWRQAVDSLHGLTARDKAIFTPHFLTTEHKQVVLGATITDVDGYLNEPRRGRKVKLDRVQKIRFWNVVTEFRRLLRTMNRTTFDMIAAQAAEIAHSNRLPRFNRYDHVIVDEGQDLSPAHWRLLRGVVPAGPNDLFICEDAHQRIYGERLVLAHYGIATRGLSKRLTLNYRMTKQALGYASQILGDEEFIDLDDADESTSRYRSLLTGPDPDRHPATSRSAEKQFIVRTIKEWLSEPNPPTAGSIGVLAYLQDTCDDLLQALTQNAIPAVAFGVRGAMDDTSVQVLTMHRAKGTEFARCIVAGVDSDTVPLRPYVERATPEERPELELRDRCLLYVACTRARDRLLITWAGAPSPFLPTPVDGADS